MTLGAGRTFWLTPSRPDDGYCRPQLMFDTDVTAADVQRADLEREDISQGPAQRQPEPAARRGIALCLSGGGYRAALFHLGAITRLNEQGVLAQVNTFSCVSGGSILGGY